MPPAFSLVFSPICIWAEASGIARRSKSPTKSDASLDMVLKPFTFALRTPLSSRPDTVIEGTTFATLG